MEEKYILKEKKIEMNDTMKSGFEEALRIMKSNIENDKDYKSETKNDE